MYFSCYITVTVLDLSGNEICIMLSNKAYLALPTFGVRVNNPKGLPSLTHFCTLTCKAYSGLPSFWLTQPYPRLYPNL